MIRSSPRALREACAWAGGAFAFAALFCACYLATTYLFWRLLDDTKPLVVTTIVVSCIGSLLCFVILRRKLGLAIVSRRAVVILAASYAVTWAFGVPQVYSDLAATEIDKYKQLRAEGNRVWEAHPSIRFFVSIPVAPGIILTYHEYQLAGLYGAGAWDIHAWFGAGSRRLFGFSLWVS